MKIEYNGPSALEETWRDFADRYTSNGTAEDRVLAVNVLNELVNTNIAPAAFIAKHGKTVLNTFKKKDNVCEAQSNESGTEGPGRELNDYILTQLLHKWMELLTAEGLYPPPESGSVSGTVKAKRDRVRQGESAGGLLSSAIASACLRTIGGAVKETKGKLTFADGADLSIADSEAPIIFHNTLFIFDDTKGNQEKNTGARFKGHLYGRILTIATRKVLDSIPDTVSLDAQRGHGDERTGHEKIADERADDPSAKVERDDQIASVLAIVERELEGRDLEIFKRRFGINEEGRIYTLEEIAEEFDISKERVRQIGQRTLRIVRSHANEDEESTQPKKRKPASTPTPIVIKPVSTVVKPTPTVVDTVAPPLPVQPIEPVTSIAPSDYPYISLIPVAGEISDDLLMQRKLAEAQHITDMLTAGMSSKWTAKPKFYDDVFAQWQAILATRKTVAGAGIADQGQIRDTAIDLVKSLIMNAPDNSHAQAMLTLQAHAKTNELSYNAIFKRFGEVDFHHPQKIAESLVYDPRWRAEVAGYLARVPAALLSQQLHEVHKPTCFDKSASFGECLEAYVFCGGNNIKEFFNLYATAKGHVAEDQSINIRTLRDEINETLPTESKIDYDVLWSFLKDDRHKQLTIKSRDILSERYKLTPDQRKCLDLINGTLKSLDTVEEVLGRAEERLKAELNAPTSLDMNGIATSVLKELMAIQPDLTAESLSRQLEYTPTPNIIIKAARGGTFKPDTYLTVIDRMASILTNDKPEATRKAANLMLGLPSTQELSFSDSIAFARKEGYTLGEFMDLRRCTMRDEIITHWKKNHSAEKFKAVEAMQEFLLGGKPDEIKLSGRKIQVLRFSNNEDLPSADALDFLAGKLGATQKSDFTGFRQLVYAQSLDAGREKVNADLEELKKAANDDAKRPGLQKKLILDIQERDGIRYEKDLVRAMIDHAEKTELISKGSITVKALAATVQGMIHTGASASADRAKIIASYVFPEDDASRQLMEKLLSGAVIAIDPPEVLETKTKKAFIDLKENAKDSKSAKEKFGVLLDVVCQRELVKTRKELAALILKYTTDHDIIPEDGLVTERHIWLELIDTFGKSSKVKSPVRAKAIAEFIFPDDEQNRTALESLLTNGIGAGAGQSFTTGIEVRRIKRATSSEVE